MSGAHGGNVHHNPVREYLEHHLALEIVLIILAVAITAVAAVAAVRGLQAYAAIRAPEILYSYYHAYDEIEDARLERMVNVPAADRSYDPLEDLRVTRDLGD